MTGHRFIWHHRCHGILAIEKHLDELIIKMKAAPYPVPDENKLLQTMQLSDTFQYAIQLLTVKKVPLDFDIDKINL
jgi:hypothetical protein